jgi:hypothetical protein
MTEDFLPANPGLPRRFPYRIWMQDYTPEQLVEIFLGALAAALSDPPPNTPLIAVQTRTFFTNSALAFLSDIIESARADSEEGVAVYPLLNQTFAAQAGAMVTLANTAALLIATHKQHGRIGLNNAGIDTWAIGLIDLHSILTTLLVQQLGPHAASASVEVVAIATVHGWFASGSWQVPPDRVAPPPLRRRVRG